jgi:hypothetical protein
MSSIKINNLNPVQLYGYHQHEDMQCNTPMTASYCRTRTNDSIQAKYNKIHYPTETNEQEGFQNIFNNLTQFNIFDYITNYISNFFNMLYKNVEGNTNMNNTIHKSQIPSFKKSKVSPIDNNHNNILVNELYLKQTADSQYDKEVHYSPSKDTLIQK